MLWLVWHMWILIGLAFAGGVIAGWIARGRSDETPERPMLETLDATVVAPVAEPTPEPAASKPASSEPEPVEAPKAQNDAEPAPAPEAGPEFETEDDAEPTPAEPDAPAIETPAAEAAPADDLTAIKGLGPKAAEKLNADGVTRFAEIAAWKAADIERFDALINGRGRIVRDEWVKQAQALVKG